MALIRQHAAKPKMHGVPVDARRVQVDLSQAKGKTAEEKLAALMHAHRQRELGGSKKVGAMPLPAGEKPEACTTIEGLPKGVKGAPITLRRKPHDFLWWIRARMWLWVEASRSPEQGRELLAKRLGISRSTVDRVLAGYPTLPAMTEPLAPMRYRDGQILRGASRDRAAWIAACKGYTIEQIGKAICANESTVRDALFKCRKDAKLVAEAKEILSKLKA